MGNNSLCKLNKDEILCGGTIDGVIKVISISEKKIIYKINNHFFWHNLDALSEFGFCSGSENIRGILMVEKKENVLILYLIIFLMMLLLLLMKVMLLFLRLMECLIEIEEEKKL